MLCCGEQLGFIRLKSPNSMHLLIVPRLMTGRWRRHLTRGTDGYSILKDEAVWNITQHYEPLLIFVCLPFRSDTPKLQERSHLLERFKRIVYQQGVPTPSTSKRRDLLRKLFCDAVALPLVKAPGVGHVSSRSGSETFQFERNWMVTERFWKKQASPCVTMWGEQATI